jgi:hypothetical protein
MRLATYREDEELRFAIRKLQYDKELSDRVRKLPWILAESRLELLREAQKEISELRAENEALRRSLEPFIHKETLEGKNV